MRSHITALFWLRSSSYLSLLWLFVFWVFLFAPFFCLFINVYSALFSFTGCSTVLLPDRVVQALNLNLEAMEAPPNLQPRCNGSFNGEYGKHLNPNLVFVYIYIYIKFCLKIWNYCSWLCRWSFEVQKQCTNGSAETWSEATTGDEQRAPATSRMDILIHFCGVLSFWVLSNSVVFYIEMQWRLFWRKEKEREVCFS